MTTTDATHTTCSRCAAPLPAGTRFCTTCGTPAPSVPPPRQALDPRVGAPPPIPTQRWMPPPGPPAPPTAPPPQERARTSRGLVAAIVVLAVVALVLGVVIVLGTPWAPGVGTTAADPTSTTSAPLPADPAQALQVQRQADAGAVEQLVGAWVPQLSAKRAGMVIDGRTYDAAAVLADHQRLRAAHPDAVLVWSGDWASFRGRDFWITLVRTPFPTGEAANAWCAGQGIGADDCYAKRLARTGEYADNTRLRDDEGAGTTLDATVPSAATPVVGWAGWAPGSTGYGDVRPAELNANGDGTSYVTDVSWSSWGGPTATGRGTASYVPPDGFVSDGVQRPAVVIASDLGDCHGRLGYRSVGWYFPTEGETSLPPGNGYQDICDGP